MANHTPTIARPMSAETCPEEGAPEAAAAAAAAFRRRRRRERGSFRGAQRGDDRERAAGFHENRAAERRARGALRQPRQQIAQRA
jgi:hypothetical protein